MAEHTETDPTLAPHLWTVILAGGVGSRFWPASTPAQPKQLLPLASDRPLIQDTVERILPLVPQDRLRILTGAHLADALLDALPELEPGNLLIEPRAAGTAPVLTWAATEIERRDPEAIMISLHADHLIDPAEAFRTLLADAAGLAVRHRRLFTVGVPPTRPETGYGYIKLGEPLDASGESDEERTTGFRVDSFVEKPDASTAERYLAAGDYLWNSGLFVWRVRDFLDEVAERTPELAELLPVLREGGVDVFFRDVPTLSVDEGVLERSGRVATVPATFGWDDVGAWDAMLRAKMPDAGGNVTVGDAYPIEASRNVMYSDGGPVVAFGVDDLVIVRASGVTFVTHRDRAPQLKTMLDHLPERLRSLR